MNTAKLYDVSDGFIIHYPFEHVDQIKIGYSDGGIFTSLVDDTEPQIFLTNLEDFDPQETYKGDKLCYGNVIFSYDSIKRDLTCEFLVNGITNSFHISLTTPKQKWEDETPGPYITIRIGDLHNYVNPCASLSYVYHDGSYMLSDPMQIDVIIPVSREQDVRAFLKTLKETNALKTRI